MNDQSTGHQELRRTAYLENTLRRARSSAEQRSHRYVTMEHFLLALLDDPDAVELLEALGADIAIIHSTAADTVNRKMQALAVSDGRPPSFSYKFDALFHAAAEDAARAGREEIDGALALIGIAREPDSRSAALLAANGFYAQEALNYFNEGAGAQSQLSQTAAESQAPSRAQRPAREKKGAASKPKAASPQPGPAATNGPGSRPASAGKSADAVKGADKDSSQAFMEDILASVRNILDDEERKHPPPLASQLQPPSAPLPPSGPAQPRFEQQALAEAAAWQHQRAAAEPRGQGPSLGQERIEPVLRAEPSLHPASAPPDRRPEVAGGGAGFSEPPQGRLVHDGPPSPPREKTRKGPAPKKGAGRARGERPGLIAKILQGVPAKLRVGTAETIRIQLTKEEAGLLFARLPRSGPPRLGPEARLVCRAVTVRLAALQGGIFIEASSPATQWIFDGPSTSGEEAWGTWTWTAIPNERGKHSLAVSISARDVDAYGLLGDIQVPDQAIEVRARGSVGRSLWSFVKTILTLLTGAGLTVGAWYVLKTMGKLPDWVIGS